MSDQPARPVIGLGLTEECIVAKLVRWTAIFLPEALADAQQEYGHLTSAELQDMRMSRGHAVGTCY